MNFDDQQLTIIRRFAAAIIPSDATPGADQAPIAEMIVATAESWPEVRQIGFMSGLEFADQFAIGAFGAPIADLSPELFAELVANIAAAPEWAEFWIGLRSLVCLDFYALPVGYEPIGMPGPTIDSGGIPL